MSIINKKRSGRYRSASVLAALLLSLLSFSSPGHAQLLELDLLLPGDGWVTRDTVNNLDWIDLTVTDGWSVDDALASVYVTAFGYDVATAAEVDSLFETAGLSAGRFNANQSAEESVGYATGLANPVLPPTVPTVEALNAFQTLGPLLGYTAQVSISILTSDVMNGYFSDDPSIDWVGLSDNRYVATPRGSNWTLKYNVDQAGVDSSTSASNAGVYLVRASQDPPGC